MDFEREILHINEALKDHNDSLARHRQDITGLQRDFTRQDKKIDEFSRELATVKATQEKMEANMKMIDKKVEAVQNQNVVTLKELKKINRLQVLLIAAVIAIVIAIFIAGGEFKKSFLDTILKLAPGLAQSLA